MYSVPARMKGTYRRITPSSSSTEKLCATPAAAAISGGIGGWNSGRRSIDASRAKCSPGKGGSAAGAAAFALGSVVASPTKTTRPRS